MAHQYSEYFERFWQVYGRDEHMNPAKKGTKYDVYMSWQKAGKKWAKIEGVEFSEEAFLEAVGRGYNSNRRNREAARKAKEWVQNLPMASTWLNRMTFMDVHEVSTGELRQREVKTECAGCGIKLINHNPSGREVQELKNTGTVWARFCGLNEEGEPMCSTCDVRDWSARNNVPQAENGREFYLNELAKTDLGRRLLEMWA